MRAATAFMASIGFAASLGVHLLTFFDVSLPDRQPALWALHVGVFVVFIPFCFIALADIGIARKYDWWRTLFRRHPRWVLRAVYALFAYAILNFFLGIALTHGGVADSRGGTMVLQSHGSIITTLSPDEYEHYQALTARMFSGHWLLFYGIPLLYLGTTRETDTLKKHDIAP